jgi:hypothetical protein
MMRFSAVLPWLLVGTLASLPGEAQVTVNPTGVNVASQGATTVFLTFGGLGSDFVAAEAFWCGELMPASPDAGQRCDPATLFGQLPARFDLSRPSGSGAFTDIMSIPASVSRRAWQAAANGAPAAFFYVRRFANRTGGPDVYVAVTCRMTSGGATTPLSLTNVAIVPESDAPLLVLQPGVPAPSWFADIQYTGTGTLKGRWEVVLPGEELPAAEDLLAEAALPLELRGTQRRWMQLERFSVFLPPSGRVRLPGPDPARLPRDVDGAYLVLLRIEATDERDGRSSLDAVGAGSGFVASGAVAGFPMPTLRYFVGSGEGARSVAARELRLVAPDDAATVHGGGSFIWMPWSRAARYRLEIATLDGATLFEAVVHGNRSEYQSPPFLPERTGGGALRWRVRALDAEGRELARSAWRAVTIPAS